MTKEEFGKLFETLIKAYMDSPECEDVETLYFRNLHQCELKIKR